MTFHDQLIGALTEFDRKQSGKRGHNPHALAIYFARADEVETDIAAGAAPADAVAAGFSGSLLRFLQRKLSLEAKPEAPGWCYRPVKSA